ncbi:MAG: type II toxin-antitoxin system RatA family toxin [Alphaproteobacteria bacterium]|nr:type II toxin-antitoxin system RatA family toxin [Alphaproteobacteria bacterium]
MLRHHEKKHLSFSAEQIFDLVADVEKYPEFLPWCLAARIHHRDEQGLRADLVVGSGPIRETFTSRVELHRPHRIIVHYDKGPLARMNNSWKFNPISPNQCTIEFSVEFEFKSRMLQMVMERIFDQVIKRMVNAFELRAHQLYN